MKGDGFQPCRHGDGGSRGIYAPESIVPTNAASATGTPPASFTGRPVLATYFLVAGVRDHTSTTRFFLTFNGKLANLTTRSLKNTLDLRALPGSPFCLLFRFRSPISRPAVKTISGTGASHRFASRCAAFIVRSYTEFFSCLGKREGFAGQENYTLEKLLPGREFDRTPLVFSGGCYDPGSKYAG